MIQPERIHPLNNVSPRRGRYVVYWMQASQRAEQNHALEYAVGMANDRNEPLVCFFGLTAGFPEANARHYTFMLQGLAQTESALKARGIRLVMRIGGPDEEVAKVAANASAVVVDRGYLRVQKDWRARAARKLKCPLVEVESDAIVPVDLASDKEEYAAATIRPKIHRHLKRFLAPLRRTKLRRDSLGLRIPAEKSRDIAHLLTKLKVDRSVKPVSAIEGGTSVARRLLRRFLDDALKDYASLHSEPGLDGTSRLSPYLHFGQISPLEIALAIQKAKGKPRNSKDDFLEELIVRRELSLNFVYYNPLYDEYRALPDWAVKTLDDHRNDPREYRYTLKELETASTHDPYWNAAMEEMLCSGFMQGYMRMYWGKKILEWSPTPEEAFRRVLTLNNRYFLDGRDPNSFASVAWCFGKHDRPWGERPIFGKVRYMNAKGLERKFDMERYVEKVESLQRA
jgi:deoxyribodipyrimidine photo-lyase